VVLCCVLLAIALSLQEAEKKSKSQLTQSTSLYPAMSNVAAMSTARSREPRKVTYLLTNSSVGNQSRIPWIPDYFPIPKFREFDDSVTVFSELKLVVKMALNSPFQGVLVTVTYHLPFNGIIV